MAYRRARIMVLAAASVAAVFAPIGLSSARADELVDLRANNDLLQQRLDQIAQTQSMGPTRMGSTDVQAMTARATAGSFARSFLIPGTDTSIRIGGQISEVADYYFEGGPANNSPQNTTVGANGQVQNISGTLQRARGSNIFLTSPRESKFGIETRTPTPYGEVRTFMEFDWAGSTQFAPGSVNPTSVSDNLVPRPKYLYGTLGNWLVGQANSNFSDSDANGETLDFGGNVGEPGVVRIPQIRYSIPLSFTEGAILSFSAETPETDIGTPGGIISSDGASSTLNAGPGLPGQLGGVCTGVTVAGTGCSAGNPTLMANPTKAGAPDLTASLYIPQPWGHVDVSLVLRPDLVLSDGAFLSRTFIGYGGHVGFDLTPGWFTPKDDIIFQIVAGDGIGRYLNSNSNFAIATNFLTTTRCVTGCAANAAGDITAASLIAAKTTTEWGGEIGYQHWWNDELRSNVNFGINHHDIPAATIGPAAVGGANHRLETLHVNLIWNPVAFVDVGIEYFWGNRQVVAVSPGAPPDVSMQGLISKVAVRF